MRRGKLILWVCLGLCIFYLLLPYLLTTVGVKGFIVKSGSMQHPDQEAFEEYWQSRGIAREDIPFRTGLRTSDFIFVKETKEVQPGDVIVYLINRGKNFAVHRAFAVNGSLFRDVEDWCFKDGYLDTITLGVRGGYIIDAPLNNYSAYDVIYDAPRIENCTRYWRHTNVLEGKAVARLPYAGLLQVIYNCASDSHNCPAMWAVFRFSPDRPSTI